MPNCCRLHASREWDSPAASSIHALLPTMASSQDATDADRGHLERRALLSDLYQLIVEHIGEDGDD
jgi:hypothetical protein